jgi:hypothetical protein
MSQSSNTASLAPQGTVGSVTLINAAHNEYGAWKSVDDAFLLPTGQVRIDGLVLSPSDVLYIEPDTKRFSNEIPESLYQNTARSLQSYINNMIEQSAGINRSVSREPLSLPSNTGDPLVDLFADPGREAWETARYPNARPGWGSDLRPLKWIDSVCEHHDPVKLSDAIVRKHIDEHYRFVVGGYLHVGDSDVTNGLDPARAKAIRRYAEIGGRLGKSALDALGIGLSNNDRDSSPSPGM